MVFYETVYLRRLVLHWLDIRKGMNSEARFEMP